MRKQSLRWLCVGGLVLLVFTGQSWAQRVGPYLNLGLGAAFVQDINGTFADTPGKLSFDTGVRGSLAVGYTLYSSDIYEAAVQFETGVVHANPHTLSSDFFDSSVDGDFWQVPVLADIIYTFSLGPAFVPYIGRRGRRRLQ